MGSLYGAVNVKGSNNSFILKIGIFLSLATGRNFGVLGDCQFKLAAYEPLQLKNCCTGHQTSSEDFIGTKLSSDYYLPKLYCQRTGIKEEGGECCGSRVPLEVVLLY